ncbi:MAG: methionyl-tRNA formyltransferase [Pseudomonadota bacterium]
MRLVFMGTPDFSVPALEALIAAGHEISCVYTQPPRPAGRGKKDRPSPVHERANTLGFMVRHPKTLKSVDIQREFAELNAEIAVVVAYGLILPQAVLDAPSHGCLNIHASLLPRWRGAAPIHRAIMAGDTESGVCIMQMEVGLDTGPVLLQRETPIAETETTGELHDRLAVMGGEMIVETLRQYSTLKAKPQPEVGVTYANKIDKAEARVDWTKSNTVVSRHINGLSPFPGAWTEVDGVRLKLLRAQGANQHGEPGAHLGGFRIACGVGAVDILEAQKQGKRPMSADDLLRGLDLPPRLS